MIKSQDLFITSSRISRDDFAATFDVSWDVTRERDPREYYDNIVRLGVDPLFVRAVFEKESNAGTKGIAAFTHSWGNMRNPPVGGVPYHFYTDPTKGSYLSFTDWLDGCLATCAHMLWYFSAFNIRDIGSFPYKWAPAADGNDPEAYGKFLVDYMNAHATGSGTVGKRIVVSAGHENIGNITSEKIGQESADNLRTATGANGEVEYNIAWADALVAHLLTIPDWTVVRTDAIYHEDVYAPFADMIIVGHYDGADAVGHPQYCMGSTVYSGDSWVSTDNVANSFMKSWYAIYPQLIGIAGNGPITVDMKQYYGGWYRDQDTPMVIIEHCLGADSSGQRSDRPTPMMAAQADASVFAQFFSVSVSTPPVVSRIPNNSPNGFAVAEIFWPRWNYMDTLGLALPHIGYPLTDKVVVLSDGRLSQKFERGTLAGTNAADVVTLFPGETPQ